MTDALVRMQAKPLPPGPRWGLPATLRLIRDPYAVLRDLRARYGDLVTFPSMNGKLVLAMTPELGRQILSSPPETFGPFAVGAIGEIIGKRSLLATEGEVHKADRKLLTPPFRGARMRAYGEQMQAVAKRRFDEALRPGREVKMMDVTTDITIDIILQAVFGVGEGPDFDEGRRLLYELVNVSPLLLFTTRSHTRLFPPYRRFMATRARFQAWLSARINEARARGEEGVDILAMMLAARYDDGSALSEEDLYAQLVTLLFAGHETTAISLAWAVHWLWRHPEMLAALRAEVAEAGDEASPETLAKLPLLGAICDETLRLNPIVTENLRMLRKPLQLGDYLIPAGVGVGVAIGVIHEDEELYPDPQSFRPERFLERKFDAFEYLPFGGGHRRCIGASFALYEMHVTLATLVASGIELELLRPDEKPSRRSVTMAPAHGVPVRVR
jgi:cytochrome P450 family 110